MRPVFGAIALFPVPEAVSLMLDEVTYTVVSVIIQHSFAWATPAILISFGVLSTFKFQVIFMQNKFFLHLCNSCTAFLYQRWKSPPHPTVCTFSNLLLLLTILFLNFFVIFFLGVLLSLVNLPDSVPAYFNVNLIHMELSFTSCAVQHN